MRPNSSSYKASFAINSPSSSKGSFIEADGQHSGSVLSVSPRHSNYQHQISHRGLAFSRDMSQGQKLRPTSSHSTADKSVHDKVLMRRGIFLESDRGKSRSTIRPVNHFSSRSSGSSKAYHSHSIEDDNFGLSKTLSTAENEADPWGNQAAVGTDPWDDSSKQWDSTTPGGRSSFVRNENASFSVDKEYYSIEQGTLERPIPVDDLDLDAREDDIKQRLHARPPASESPADNVKRAIRREEVVASSPSNHNKSLGKGFLRLIGSRARASQDKGTDDSNSSGGGIQGLNRSSSRVGVEQARETSVPHLRKFGTMGSGFHQPVERLGFQTGGAMMPLQPSKVQSDASLVSEITNPTVFTQHREHAAVDPFVDPFFISTKETKNMRLSKLEQPIRTNKEFGLNAVASDDFSDPFFPASSEERKGFARQLDDNLEEEVAFISTVPFSAQDQGSSDSDMEEKKEQERLTTVNDKRFSYRGSLLSGTASYRGIPKSSRQQSFSMIHTKPSISSTAAVKHPHISSSVSVSSGRQSKIVMPAAVSPVWNKAKKSGSGLSMDSRLAISTVETPVAKPSEPDKEQAIEASWADPGVSLAIGRTPNVIIRKPDDPSLSSSSSVVSRGRTSPKISHKFRGRQHRSSLQKSAFREIVSDNQDGFGQPIISSESDQGEPGLASEENLNVKSEAVLAHQAHECDGYAVTKAHNTKNAAHYQGRLQRLQSRSPKSKVLRLNRTSEQTRPDPPLQPITQTRPKIDAPAHSYATPTVSSRKKERETLHVPSTLSSRKSHTDSAPTHIHSNNIVSSSSSLAQQPSDWFDSQISMVGHLSQENSISTGGEVLSSSLAAMGADISKLRTLMKQARSKPMPERALIRDDSESMYSSCDESSIKDPVHRAGVRFLSKAVVPIQAAIRRHLALRVALARMWAIVIMQALARRYLAQKRYFHSVVSAIMIQAWWRGSRARDWMLLKHCCAIEIQRYVRGHLATMRVYEDIFRVTIVQSLVRRKLAMSWATERMIFIIQVQSIVRRFLCRRRLRKVRAAAIKVQTTWRSFFCQFNYQLDLLDIIVVQSIWRQKQAIQEVGLLRYENYRAAATKIQSHFRAHVCRTNYAILRAITKIQSLWRSYCCKRAYMEYRAVTKIQARWRGFICARTYLEYVAAVVLQAQVRMFLCSKRYIEYIAATVIQSKLRSYACRKAYVEYLCARQIQAKIRRFVARKKYVEYTAAMIIQAQIRCYICSRRYIEYMAATLIQSQFRGQICRKSYRVSSACRRIQTAYRAYSCRIAFVEYCSARRIQTAFRRYYCRSVFIDYVSARRIQTCFRRYIRSKTYIEYMAAMVIQAHFRCYHWSSAYKKYLAARRIQANVRRIICSKIFERQMAATLIQAFVRKVLCRVAYREYIAARRIQTQFRRYLCHQPYTDYISARKIQSQVRGYLCRLMYTEYLAARSIQAAYRSHACFQAYKEYMAARRIQCFTRMIIFRTQYKQYKSARVIQAAYRRQVCFHAFRSYMAARCIQARVRGYLSYVTYNEYVAARFIQAHFRRYISQTAYTGFITARKIQALFRGYQSRKRYQRISLERRCAVMIQGAWRGYVCLRSYVEHLAAMIIQKQYKHYQMCRDRRRTRAALMLQSYWRGCVSRRSYNRLRSAVLIQAYWRMYLCSKAYLEYIAAMIVQTHWRGLVVKKAYQRVRAAVKIQSHWRAFVCSRIYLHYVAATMIQAQYRMHSHRKYFVRHRAATRIQAAWRSYDCTMNFLRVIADLLVVQSVVRRWSAQRHVARLRNDCALTLQRAVRVYLARSALHSHREKQNAAICIQRVWRGFVVHTEYCFTVAYVVICQSIARRMIATKRFKLMQMIRKKHAIRIIQTMVRETFARKVLAATRIQCFWRGFVGQAEYLIAKCENAAATTIQSFWRRFWCYTNFLIRLHSAILIQSTYRMHKSKELYSSQAEAISVIQACMRHYLAKKRITQESVLTLVVEKAHQTELLERRNSTHIQRVFRGSSSRAMIHEYLAARYIQTAWRRSFARSYYIDYISARRIQAFWRAMTVHVPYCRRKAVIRIQCFWRQREAHRLFLALREEFMVDEIKAALFLQKIWRGMVVRSTRGKFVAWRRRMNVEDPAAIVIQKAWRGFSTMLMYWHALGSAIQIQSAMRGWITRVNLTKELSLIMIQSSVRGYLARTRFERHLATVYIQKVLRGANERRLWEQMKANQRNLQSQIASATLIQKSWRGFAARVVVGDMLVLEDSAIMIQTIGRGFIARGQYTREKSAIRLQATFRRCLARVKAAERLGAVIFLQSVARGMIARLRAIQARRDFSPSFFTSRSRDTRLPSSQAYSENSAQSSVASTTIEDQAARTIQRFLLMVKAEVDREIRRAREKRRRRKRRASKKHTSDEDEEMLENIWSTAMEDSFIKAVSLGRNESLHIITSFSRCEGPRSTHVRSGLGGAHLHETPLVHNYPSDAPSPLLRASFNFRVPPSRLTTLSRDEIEDDLFLEEAWIDTEIRQAKERRQFGKSKKSGKSVSNRPSSRASNHDRPSSRASQSRPFERPPSRSSHHHRRMV